jgi:dihydropteroate synthase
VAQKVVKEGEADIINDISGGEMDNKMFDVISELNVPYILTHIKGNPQTMQNNPYYKDLMGEIMLWFAKKVELLRNNGVKDIIIDPGFGFGKTLEQNFILLKNLQQFKFFELPILIGVSRKSMIYKSIGITPEESLNGTTVLNTLALLGGANILRVHDVKEAVECVNLTQKVLS